MGAVFYECGTPVQVLGDNEVFVDVGGVFYPPPFFTITGTFLNTSSSKSSQ